MNKLSIDKVRLSNMPSGFRLNIFAAILLFCIGLSSFNGYAQNVSAKQFESTNLPLVVIDTKGQDIPDEPKVTADMKIIHNGESLVNKPTDVGNVYSGKVGIEIRGSYSATLPQKPYGFETRDSLGENLNISILGMPKENDWILLANYNDKVFMRNLLAFHLFEKMGHYAPKAHLCEVIINDEYQGVYILTEKIKRDKNRVDIAKLDADDNAGDSVTGGYIFKIDYPNSNSWVSDYQNPNYEGSPVYWVPEYPKNNDMTSEQLAYLTETISNVEDVIWGENFDDPISGYRSLIDVSSFIDYFLVNEFARNMDGYKKSRRFYKDKDSKDPLIYAGPVWDFDWAFKDQEYSMLDGEGWQYSYTGPSDIKPPGWYIRLFEDSYFANKVNCRYEELKTTLFSITYLINYVDSVALLVNEAQARHYEKWPILGENVGTPEIGNQPTSFDGDIVKFKMWILERLMWLNDNMPGSCSDLVSYNIVNKTDFNLYPNPAHSYLNIESDKSIQSLRILDLMGRLIYFSNSPSGFFVRVETDELNGIFMIEVLFEDGTMEQRKVVLEND